MAKQKLMADLASSLTAIDGLAKLLPLRMQAVASANGAQLDTAIKGTLSFVGNLEVENNKLAQRIRAADAHAASWGQESRWKKVKNVAIPKLTSTRNELRALSASATQNLRDSEKLVKRTRLILARAQLSA